MAKQKKEVIGIKMLTDQPLGKDNPRVPSLRFEDYAAVLSEVILGTPGPFTIGVFGDWGMGKTSLMQLIKNNLDNENVLTVWFNAWKYEQTEVPLIPVINAIIREIGKNQKILSKLKDEGEQFLAALESVIVGLNWKFKAPVGLATLELSGDQQKMFEHAEKLDKKLKKGLPDEDPFSIGLQELDKIVIPDDVRIVVIIDDLDRCFPQKAIKLLESIKLILEKKGFIFVLGLDRDILTSYLDFVYKNEYGLDSKEGQEYLGKIIQLEFPIPPHTDRMEKLANELLKEIEDPSKEDLVRIVPMLAEYLGANPRTLVRLINNLILDLKISELTLPDDIPVEFFGIARCMQLSWPHFYRLILSGEEYAQHVHEYFSEEDLQKWKDESNEDPKKKRIADILLDNHELVDLMKTPEGLSWLSDYETVQRAAQFLFSTRSDLYPSINELIELGHKQGYVTFSNILKYFPDAKKDISSLERAFGTLLAEDIPYHEEDDVEEIWAKLGDKLGKDSGNKEMDQEDEEVAE